MASKRQSQFGVVLFCLILGASIGRTTAQVNSDAQFRSSWREYAIKTIAERALPYTIIGACFGLALGLAIEYRLKTKVPIGFLLTLLWILATLWFFNALLFPAYPLPR